MKKTIRNGALCAALGLFFCQSAIAQTPENQNDFNGPVQDVAKDGALNSNVSATNKGKSAAAVLWSEDFASGFTGGTNGTWTTSGANSNLVTYDTDGPDSLLQFGWGPIPSPTASNGFAIFDFYRRIPDVAGFASSPAEGLLTSPTINLGSNSDVYISFYQQLFWCCEIGMDIWLEVSTDGGTTWPNQYKVNVSDRNVRHWNVGHGYYFEYNISSAVAANPSNVKIRFNWTSLTADANGQYSNAYFWMIDDIEISELPANDLKFTDYQGAPAKDIIFGNPGDAKMGYQFLSQVDPISFDANAYNFGSKAQTDVQLTVDIYRNGSLENTLVSPVLPVLNPGDTATYNDLYTPTFTPTAVGTYEAVYSISSDSIPAQPGSSLLVDTPYTFVVTDGAFSTGTASLDFGNFGNSIGTTGLGNDGSAVASMFYFTNPTANSGAKLMVQSLDIYFSSSTVAGGDIQVEIYDTTGFDFTTGFGGSNIISLPFTVDATYPGNLKNLDLSNYNIALDLDKGYFVVIYMFSNAGANPILIGNDQTIDQPGLSSIMYNTTAGRWYTGYAAPSRNFESPMIRLNGIIPTGSIAEAGAADDFSVYPNPTNGENVTVKVNNGGTYTIELVNLTGQTIKSSKVTVNSGEEVSMNYSSVASGVYLMNVKSENGTKSVKLTIK